MKFKIFLFSLLVLFSFASVGYADTSDTTIVTLEIVYPFDVEILSPVNGSYIVTILDLSYSTQGSVSWCGYSLNGYNNVTLIGNTTIVAAEGINSLYVFCNDTYGNETSSFASFSVVTGRDNPHTRGGLPEENGDMEDIDTSGDVIENVSNETSEIISDESIMTDEMLFDIENFIKEAEALIFITPEIKSLLELAREEMNMADYAQALASATDALNLTRLSLSTCTAINIALSIVVLLTIVYLFSIRKKVIKLDYKLEKLRTHPRKRK